MNEHHIVLLCHKSADIAISIGNLCKVYAGKTLGYLSDTNNFNPKKINPVTELTECDVTILHDPILFKYGVRKHRKHKFVLIVKQFHIQKILAFIQTISSKHKVKYAFVGYNSDRILLKPSVFWLPDYTTLNNTKDEMVKLILQNSKTDGRTIIYYSTKPDCDVANYENAVAIYKIELVENVTRIIWTFVPSYVYYCEIYQRVFNRENYPERAKNTVNVESIFLIHDKEVSAYNKLYKSILSDEAAFNETIKTANYKLYIEGNKIVTHGS